MKNWTFHIEKIYISDMDDAADKYTIAGYYII